VDIYLPDFKYWDAKTAQAYSHAPDYPLTCRRAIAEMVRQSGELTLDENGMAVRGVLVRHLLLPSQVRAAKQILAYLNRTYGSKLGVSLLRQYTPMPATAFTPLDRAVYDSEYESVLESAQDYTFSQFYTQEKSSVGEAFIPDFNQKGSSHF
jgi:putative pyruvate formate lyase activating enzyme